MSTPVEIAIGVLGAQAAAAVLGNLHGWMLKLSTAALTGAAAFAGLVKRAIDTADESKKMADRVNISVESFTELKYGASLAGAEAGDLRWRFGVFRSGRYARGGIMRISTNYSLSRSTSFLAYPRAPHG